MSRLAFGPTDINKAMFPLQAFVDYGNTTDTNLLESMMKELNEEIRNLWDTLMGLELQLVDQLEVNL